MAQQPHSEPRPPHCRGFMIILRHTKLSLTPLDERLARSRDHYLTKSDTHKRHSCPRGIRSRNPSKRGATDPRLKPCGHRDRLNCPVIRRHSVLINESVFKLTTEYDYGVLECDCLYSYWQIIIFRTNQSTNYTASRCNLQ